VQHSAPGTLSLIKIFLSSSSQDEVFGVTKLKKRKLQKHKAETSAEGRKTKHKDEAGKESQSLPAVSALTSQGSAHETATEWNEQNMFFSPLMNCNHPLDFIVAKLMTREHHKEMTHIDTICELS
jgi:hypothetical protein